MLRRYSLIKLAKFLLLLQHLAAVAWSEGKKNSKVKVVQSVLKIKPKRCANFSNLFLE
jgi:hypothetical protein